MQNIIGKKVRFDADGKLGVVVGNHDKHSVVVLWDAGRAIVKKSKVRRA